MILRCLEIFCCSILKWRICTVNRIWFWMCINRSLQNQVEFYFEQLFIQNAKMPRRKQLFDNFNFSLFSFRLSDRKPFNGEGINFISNESSENANFDNPENRFHRNSKFLIKNDCVFFNMAENMFWFYGNFCPSSVQKIDASMILQQRKFSEEFFTFSIAMNALSRNTFSGYFQVKLRTHCT